MPRESALSHGSDVDVMRVINDIYAAALDPGLWPAAIGRIVEAVGGSSGQLLSPAADVLSQLWVTHGFDPVVMVSYAEYYNDFLKPGDFQRVVSCFMDGSNSDNCPKTSLSVYRPPGSEPLGEDVVQMLNILAPHVRRAVHFHWRIADLAHRHATSVEILEHLTTGVMLLDETVHVTYMNPAAHRFIDRKDGLTVDSGELTARLGSEAVELSRSLWRTAQATMRLEAQCSGKISITRTNGKPPYRLIAMPVPGREVFAVGRKHTAVIVLVSEGHVPLNEGVSAAAYAFGLSRAETRLVLALIEGKPLKRAADELGISVNTAHTQLASIFRKTGTHRQTELLNLVGSMGSTAGR